MIPRADRVPDSVHHANARRSRSACCRLLYSSYAAHEPWQRGWRVGQSLHGAVFLRIAPLFLSIASHQSLFRQISLFWQTVSKETTSPRIDRHHFFPDRAPSAQYIRQRVYPVPVDWLPMKIIRTLARHRGGGSGCYPRFKPRAIPASAFRNRLHALFVTDHPVTSVLSVLYNLKLIHPNKRIRIRVNMLVELKKPIIISV